VLQSVHHAASHQNEQYGIIFIDVDHFKKFNDRNGHPAGDDVLRQVATILKSRARSQDLPARYGGEEFVMVCRHSSLEATSRVAELIRSAIESTSFPFGEHQPLGKVTVSIGVSAFPIIQGGFEAVLEAADQALYQSKEKGRNRVSSVQAAAEVQKKKAS
jgi:diguanylate cyclase (GGDEF)-like protein